MSLRPRSFDFRHGEKDKWKKIEFPSLRIKFAISTSFFRLTLAILRVMLYNGQRRHKYAAEHGG